METNLTTEVTAPLYKMPEQVGWYSLGTPTKYGLLIAVYEMPTDEQKKNMREMLGLHFVSLERMAELMKEWNK